MKKRRFFYGMVFCYIVCIFLFFSFPFELLLYDVYQGQMQDSKKATLISRGPLLKKQGYIKNKYYIFSIVGEEKQEIGYITQIVFHEKQSVHSFKLYCKKTRKSIWKMILEEWRREWKN